MDNRLNDLLHFCKDNIDYVFLLFYSIVGSLIGLSLQPCVPHFLIALSAGVALAMSGTDIIIDYFHIQHSQSASHLIHFLLGVFGYRIMLELNKIIPSIFSLIIAFFKKKLGLTND